MIKVEICDFEAHVHIARVYLAEARRRRRQTFGFVLLLWASNARRRAMECRQSVQMELF
jgi:hypothetical protein